MRRMRGGAQGHLMRASDENFYIVKFQNNPQHLKVLANELLASRLAAGIGLPVPETEIVEVSEWLIRQTDEAGIIFVFVTFFPEDRLAAVGVAGPLIDDHDAGEFVEVAHALQRFIGQVIKHLAVAGIQHVTRAELQPGPARHRAAHHLQVEFRGQGIEPAAFSRMERENHRGTHGDGDGLS